jgi:hypothetical protein
MGVRKAEIIDVLAARVHEGWRRRLRGHKVKTRLSTWGEELMVPYARLSERAKELNRHMVRQVLRALEELL